MNTIFSPAVRLLNLLSYPRKFGVIGLLFALPLGLVSFFWVRELNHQIAFSAKEQRGNEYLRPVQQLASDLQEHRGLMGGRPRQSGHLEVIRQVEERLRRDIQDIDAVDEKLGSMLHGLLPVF